MGRLAWAVAFALVAIVPGAAAHAYIATSDPANGARLDELPSQVVLSFTEGIQRGEAQVIDETGRHVETGAFEVQGEIQRVVVPLEARPGAAGVFVLQWKVLSVDTHVTSGSLYFTVGNATPDRAAILDTHAAMDHDAIEWPPAVAKAVLLASLATILGAPVATSLARRSTRLPQDWGQPPLRRLVLLACATGAIASLSLALPSLQEISGDESLLTAVRQTQTGQLLILHVVVLAAVAVTAAARPRLLIIAAPLGALVCQAGISRLSHSGSFVGQTGGVAADLGHLVGSALWFGGLVALVAVIVPAARAIHTPLAPIIRRFSILALAGLTLTVAAGLLMASWFIPEPRDATTTYGSAALAKTSLLVLAVALAAVNRFWWAPRADDERGARNFRRTVAVEACLLGVVFLLSGLMTTTNTAVAAHPVPEHFAQQAEFGPGSGSIEVVPAAVGFNVFDVNLQRDGVPWEVDQNLTLLMRSDTAIEPPPVSLVPQGGGLYSAVAAIPFPANWTLRYSFFVPDEGFHTHSTNVVATGGEHQHHALEPQTVSEGSLRAPLGWAAGAVAGLGALVVAGEAVLLARRRG